MKNRKKGFTMLELIVVMALVGIFTALASLSFAYIRSGNLKSAAKTVDATLNTLRINTMSRVKTPKMYIYKYGDNYYMYCGYSAPDLNSANGTKIGNNTVKIFYGSPAKELVAADGACVISYMKGNGAFSDTSPSQILFEKEDGEGVKYKIDMVIETGKHSLEKY